MRRIFPAFMAVLLIGGTLALASTHLISREPSPCATVLGATPVKMDRCKSRVVSGADAPEILADPAPSSPEKP